MEIDGQPIHYANAPILEAFVEFDESTEDPASRASPEPHLLDRLGDLLRPDYPRSEPISFSGRFLPLGEVDQPETKGRAYATEDGKQVVRAFSDRFSFHRLTPYEHWERFINEAQRVAEIYYSVFPRPSGPVFVTVRYVNVFAIPLGRPLHEFFNVYPAWPDRDTLFTRVFMNITTTFEDPHGHLTTFVLPRGSEYHAAAPRPSDPNTFDMILDNVFSFSFPGLEEAWGSMDAIRTTKNATFNSQITARLREMIQ